MSEHHNKKLKQKKEIGVWKTKMTHLILHSETNLTAGHFQSFVKLLIFTETGLKLHAE